MKYKHYVKTSVVHQLKTIKISYIGGEIKHVSVININHTK